jgi:hypothetical protein
MNIQFERLEEVAQEYFKNLSNLSKTLGLSSQFLYSYKNRPQIGAGTLAKLATIGINIEYIKTGQGSKMDETLLLLMNELQKCKAALEERTNEISSMQKMAVLENRELHQFKLEQLFKDQRSLIEQSHEYEKQMSFRYTELRLEANTGISDDENDEFEIQQQEYKPNQTTASDANTITIYDLSTYARTERISSIEILPKSTIRIMLNIDNKDELIGLRVSGNILESDQIFDGNIIIVERGKRALEGQEIIYIDEKQLIIKIADEMKVENLIGVVKAVIQYR